MFRRITARGCLLILGLDEQVCLLVGRGDAVRSPCATGACGRVGSGSGSGGGRKDESCIPMSFVSERRLFESEV